ncbi:saccharopine dehydrogenase-like oxidoreductase [Ostrinia nubilalis]|uniref:saccharopine dehydrogenase-like oxidoreductase n=1 Tax=Ostrinia nubilalis TaxID=29057 RepID=UPI0030825090
MSSEATERLDLVVLGATGFTGKHAVKNLVKILKVNNYNFSWGISGRSKEKIQRLLTELGEEKTKIIVTECDIKKDDIRNVTRKAKVLINCTGPNTILSEPIVNACIDTKTHYVDISAELYHILNLYRTFNKRAEEANILVIPACGFAVIPVMTGLMYLEQHFKGSLNAVECYAELMIPKRAYIPGPNKCLLHYGTWGSLVYEMQNMKEYRRLKAEIFPQNIYDSDLPEIERSFFHKTKGKLWYPYPGPDEYAVEMSQRYLHEKKGKKVFRCKVYTTMPTWFHLIIMIPAMYLYYYFCYLKCFRNLLWKYPRFFTLGYVSHKGPAEEMVKDIKFAFTFNGSGTDEHEQKKSLSVKITGCDPAYQTTSMTLLVAALTILTESSKMPKGGVLPVGAAFQDTQIIDNIMRNKALTYEIIDS